MKQVFIVDDDFNTIYIMTSWLKQRNFFVQGFSDSKTLFAGLEREIPDAIMLDVRLGEEDGRDVCMEVRKRYGDKLPIILFSMYFDTIKKLKETSANDFIRKDATLPELLQMLQKYTN